VDINADILFYDGHCGLCHRSVRFVLARGARGEAFFFAPLQGDTFRQLVSEEPRRQLPDSLVLRTAQGELLTRSAAVLHIAARLGGAWRVLGAIVQVIPRAWRDALYDFIARIRHKLFARPPEICPQVPLHLRARFLP
jgi:predicted DCC family thiol-disulfide oxidoreductase YuxK